jgi:DNA (cytosine-5)-methyltransferase 1
MLVLSVFPGVDLLGMAFEAEGFCVVRGPDLIFGGDIRTFRPPAGHFVGIIGGSPCQDFSSARRTAPTGDGMAMMAEYSRVVTAARPAWALLENVPTAPNLDIPGYMMQRIDLRGTECGLTQRRIRHFQFFSNPPRLIAVPRQVTGEATEPAAVATEGQRKNRRGWKEFCGVQGLSEPLKLPGMTLAARYRAVGNGVPIPMGRAIAAAIRSWTVTAAKPRLCSCGCGRVITGKAESAGPACRKRMERRRRVTAAR